MHPASVIAEARALASSGLNPTDIARKLGIPRETIRGWLTGPTPRRIRFGTCTVCGQRHDFASLPEAYVYLLGLYLGDGCISRHPRNVHRLRIVLDLRYPGIIDSTARAIHEIRDGKALVQRRADHCAEVSAYWRCWPCLSRSTAPGRSTSGRSR